MIGSALRSTGVNKDYHWAKVVTLLSGDGANDSTTITDSSPLGADWTANGTTKLVTATKKFGTASMSFPGAVGSHITAPTGAAFAFGTGDFTIEGWVYIAAATAVANGIFQQGTSAFPTSLTNTVAFGTVTSGNKWQIYAKNTSAQSTGTWSLSTWYHFAVVRHASTTKLYVDGTSVITVSSDTTDYTGTYMGIGAIYGTAYPHQGNVDDFRVTKGLARYTTDFTPPSAAHPSRG